MSGSNHLKKRKRALEDYEERVPLGWQLDPETVRLLLKDPRKNEMVPSNRTAQNAA